MISIHTVSPVKSAIASRVRVSSIDALRGLVMVIMALDHSRDLLHRNGMFYDPTDLATTTPFLFFTRLVTHLCAPTFVFLSGVSAYLSGQKMSRRQLTWFLISRGLWMIFLELTVVNFAFLFDSTFSRIELQVMWAIGISMLMLSSLVTLPRRITLLIGLVIVLGHNALDKMHVPVGSSFRLVWALLHERAEFVVSPYFTLSVLYPVLPWVGIMTLGYSSGWLYRGHINAKKRKRILLLVGSAAILGFVFLRLLNGYGDPAHWQIQFTSLFTVMSFLNVTKYPPSLLFALLTLGIALLLLAAFEIKPGRWINFLLVYGRVPLFYYVIHFFILHGLAIIRLLLSGYSWSTLDFQNGTGGIPAGQGVSLEVTYIFWLLVVIALYPVCKQYDQFKRHQKNVIWRYL